MDLPDSPSPTRRWLRRLVYTVVVLFAVVFCFYTIENMRGRNAWHRTLSELEAKGEKIAWKDFIPAPIPDEKNMLKAPMMEEWFMGNAPPHERNWYDSMVLVRQMDLSENKPGWFDEGEFWVESGRLYPKLHFVIAELKFKPDDGREFEDDGSKVRRMDELPKDETGALKLLPALNHIFLFEDQSAELLTADAPDKSVPITIIRLGKSVTAEDFLSKVSQESIHCPFEFQLSKTADTYQVVIKKATASGEGCVLSARDYLAVSDRLAGEIGKVIEASLRPEVIWSASPESPMNDNKYPTPNLVAIMELGQRSTLRALSWTLISEPDKTDNELRGLSAARKLCRAKPNLLRLRDLDGVLFGHQLQVLASALEREQMSKERLSRWQDSLSKEDFILKIVEALRTERAMGIEVLNNLNLTSFQKTKETSVFCENKQAPWWNHPYGRRIGFSPRGWFDRNKATNAALDQEMIETCVSKERMMHPTKVNAVWGRMWIEFQENWPLSYTISAQSGKLNYHFQFAAHAQTTAHLGVLACALERHRLDTGTLPANLDSLVPKYLAKLPRQVVHAQPFHYRLEKDGGCTLWSEGWDLTDDGGKISPFEGFSNRNSNDWGYRLPARGK